MANTKDEVRVSKSFATLIKENEGLLYKVINRLFNISSFEELINFSPDNIKLEEPFENFGRMDILIENKDYFLIIENKVHNPTDLQETQTTSYYELMAKKEHEEGKTSKICYLLNKGHPDENELKKIVKKHQNSKIDNWNDLVCYLYKTSDSSEKRNIEYFYLYSKDEIDNFYLSMDNNEKLFGNEGALLSNPFLLSNMNQFFVGSETEKWILESLVVPALNQINSISNVHTASDDDYPYVVFNYLGLEYWLDLTMFYNPKLEKYCYKNSFTFYRDWIVGCQEASSEEQMIDYTRKSILMWLNDKEAQKNCIDNDDYEFSNERVFGPDVEIFSNPWLLSNTGYLITNKKPNKKKLSNYWIFENIVLPAAKKIKTLSNVKIEEYYREVFIQATYKNVTINFDLSDYYNNKNNNTYSYNSFTFYRPWIIGCRYAKDENEMINYTKNAIELWLKDIESDCL
ncbi:MAG: PD-(D/E)XK nuclease family protein [Spirochaetia bacterium]|nr:PD-(D/E)XK nuclease family protein [Spirochaetia bacterium]